MATERPAIGRRALLGLAVTLALSACGVPESPERAESATVTPVILIDIDTLRADHLGSYGYQRPTSPHLDRLADESVLFEWALSQAPNTPPSQGSILTGLYPTAHGRIEGDEILPGDVETLAEVFRENGYDTAAFVDGGMMASEFGFDQGFRIYDDAAGGMESIGPKVERYLREREDDRFLLLVHTYDVHSPYDDSPEPYGSMFLEGLERPDDAFVTHMTQRMEDRRLSRWNGEPWQLDPTEVAWAKAHYDGGIRFVDDWFASFREFLEAEGLYDEALIVVISDHGDAFEEHDTVFHEKLYSPVTRVPFFLKLPQAATTKRVDAVVETLDLMPTVLEILGLPTPEGLHGTSLVPLFDGSAGVRQLAISESPFFGRRIAVADDTWRLFYSHGDSEPELYSFRQDPLEGENVASDHPEEVRRLLEVGNNWEKSLTKREAGRAEMDSETEQQLEALGYL